MLYTQFLLSGWFPSTKFMVTEIEESQLVYLSLKSLGASEERACFSGLSSKDLRLVRRSWRRVWHRKWHGYLHEVRLVHHLHHHLQPVLAVASPEVRYNYIRPSHPLRLQAEISYPTHVQSCNTPIISLSGYLCLRERQSVWLSRRWDRMIETESTYT